MAWNDIENNEINPESDADKSIPERWRDNVEAIVRRFSGAPTLNGQGNLDFFSSSGNWQVPPNVYKIQVTVSGGGGGGSYTRISSGIFNNGGNGGDSYFAKNTTFEVKGNGGKGRVSSTSTAPSIPDGTPQGSHGGMGRDQDGANGQNGSYNVDVFLVEPGQIFSIEIGSGGGGQAGHGADGFVVIEY